MKIDIWEASPNGKLAYSRRKWERKIFKWVHTILPYRDDTDILTIVDAVYQHLERAELKAEWGEASVWAFIKLVTTRTAIQFDRKWRKKGYLTPLQPLGTRRPAQNSDSLPTAATDGLDMPLPGQDDDRADGRGPDSWADPGTPGSIGEDPAKIYERKEADPLWESGNETEPVIFCERHGLDPRHAPLLETIADGLTKAEALGKLGISRGRYKNRVGRLRKSVRKLVVGIPRKPAKPKVARQCVVCGKRAGKGLTYFCDKHSEEN